MKRKVKLAGLPPGFIDDLPDGDQKALLEAIGMQVTFHGYDEDGRVELEFKDKEGVWHFIYLDPEFVGVD